MNKTRAQLAAWSQLVVILLAGCDADPKSESMEQIDLDTYRWRNRLLIVFADSRQDNEFRQQAEMWSGQERGVEGRDMVLMHLLLEEAGEIGSSQISPEAAAGLRRRTDVPAEGFCVLLIGKDGGVKLRSSKPVSPDEVFALIDAMPMRQAELKRKRQSDGP